MDPAESNSKSDPVPDISPDGDVVLVVGPRNVRFRVHSQCLRCASKAFAAMFGPDWSEGHELSQESPREVLLEEDDADALRTICCVIHHRNDDVPQALAPDEVLQIAIEADKYDLSVALKYARAQWLKPRGNEDMVNMGYLMVAAFLFGDMDTFLAHTLALIVNYTGTYLELLDDEIISQIIPWKMFYLLEERRTRMRAELIELLVEGMNAACSCGWGEHRSNKYKALHSECRPLKILEDPISDVVKKMQKISCEELERKYHPSGCNGYYHETSSHDKKLLGKLKIVKKRASICLDCVRSMITNEETKGQRGS